MRLNLILKKIFVNCSTHFARGYWKVLEETELDFDHDKGLITLKVNCFLKL